MANVHIERIVTALFGVFFVVLAAVTLVAAWEATPLGACAVALVLGSLGVNAIASAIRGRRSWLSRIGPLP